MTRSAAAEPSPSPGAGGSARSSCSAYGSIEEPVRVAEAVAASGAFPLLLPAVERTYTFRRHSDDPAEQHVVLLTDGGDDNLGLSVLEPGRSAAHTAHAYDVDYIIASDAGRGRLPLASGHFAGARLQRSFEIVHGVPRTHPAADYTRLPRPG
jgi:NTE family protein